MRSPSLRARLLTTGVERVSNVSGEASASPQISTSQELDVQRNPPLITEKLGSAVQDTRVGICAVSTSHMVFPARQINMRNAVHTQ